MGTKIIADRFVETHSGRVVDLATGKAAVLTISPAGGPSDQRQWAARCDWLVRLYHPAIATLLDYGLIGESRRFEAWCCAVPPREAPAGATATVRAAANFLSACGLTCTGNGTVGVRGDGQGPLVALPGIDDGYTADAPVKDGLFAVGECGLVHIDRRAVASVAELFDDHVEPRHEPRTVCVWGPRGAGKTTAVLQLARVARLNGFVPISARLVARGCAGFDFGVLNGRSVFVIEDGDSDGESVWRRALVDVAIRSPRPHVATFTSREDAVGAAGAALARLSAASLIAAIRPEHLTLDARVRRAAERADGLPGRFIRLLHGSLDESRRAGGEAILVAAERAPFYGVAEGEEPAVPRSPTAWPVARDVAALRQQVATSRMLLAAGRHAPGDRGLRQAIAGLARRGDWAGAIDGSMALAASLLRRGRPRDAKTVLDAARHYCQRTADGESLVAIATLSGVAWTDLGRLGEAGSVLGAAAASCNPATQSAAPVALALARCRFWQARFREADAALDGVVTARLDAAMDIRIHIVRSRIAVGRLDFNRSMAAAAEAVRGANALTDPSLMAEAACAAAFTHLAVGDLESLERDAAACVSAARSARDPLRVFRVRLLLAEQFRRAGRRAEALEVLRVLQRFAATHLPPIVRKRYELIRDLLTCTDAADAAARRPEAAGLPALCLFCPPPASDAFACVVDDAVAMLRACEAAEDEERSLGAVCEQAQRRLEAAAVAFFALCHGTPVRIAGSGLRLDPAVAERAAAAGLPIGPHRMDDRVECAVPIRYGGAIVGALAARWTMNRSPETSRAVSVLTMAATAAAPLVQSAMASRRRVATPASHGLLGVSPAIAAVRDAAERAAQAPFAVLVEGESGSGKELVARAIHRGGPRRDQRFRTLNCAALPDDLVESELFGHARGAFTGAVAERIGVFEEANGGTLMLDEIGELSLRAQAKLLRVLQEGELRRIGENVSRRIDVRVVSATNRNLKEEAAAGRFRTDLLYRLDVVRIAVPALRERREDIPLLVDHYWQEAASRVASRATLSPAAVAVLARYDWPGNVRELQNVLAALAVRVGRRGVVGPTALPPQFDVPLEGSICGLEEARRAFDERFVRAALVRTGGRRSQASAELGISRQGLTKLMTRLGIAEGG